jgi:REP element-mobilizing transposase RayT
MERRYDQAVIGATAQLELDLPAPRRWGGRRAGAGRKPGPRPRVPHLRRDAISAHTPCHVTLRMRRGLPSLRLPALVRELERSFRAARGRDAFRLVHYSIQRDHVHLVVEADEPSALSRGMMSLGARIARAVNRVFRRRGAILADRYHHRVLRTPREVRNVLAYVLTNFRKHSAPHLALRRPSGPAIDPASSGRWFAGWSRAPAPPGGHDPIPVAPAPHAEPAPVVAARSWLLRVGWWRHGRIDPGEIPAARR